MRRELFMALALALALLVAACAQIPESPQEIEAKKMEPVAGKAVVYIVQSPFPHYGAGLAFDNVDQFTMWPSTFYRWVTTPGTHTIKSSEGRFNASIKLQLEAGKIYFVEHWVAGAFGTTTDTGLQKMDDKDGRQLVKSSRML